LDLTDHHLPGSLLIIFIFQTGKGAAFKLTLYFKIIEIQML